MANAITEISAGGGTRVCRTTGRRKNSPPSLSVARAANQFPKCPQISARPLKTGRTRLPWPRGWIPSALPVCREMDRSRPARYALTELPAGSWPRAPLSPGFFSSRRSG